MTCKQAGGLTNWLPGRLLQVSVCTYGNDLQGLRSDVWCRRPLAGAADVCGAQTEVHCSQPDSCGCNGSRCGLPQVAICMITEISCRQLRELICVIGLVLWAADRSAAGPQADELQAAGGLRMSWMPGVRLSAPLMLTCMNCPSIRGWVLLHQGALQGRGSPQSFGRVQVPGCATGGQPGHPSTCCVLSR